MKLLILSLLLTSCASKQTFVDCLDQQIELYGDICSESSTGYEDMNGSDAHFEGVKCAVESVKGCVE